MNRSRAWEAHLARSYPGSAPDEIEGYDLHLLDAECAGCIVTAINSSRILDNDVRMLKGCQQDLMAVLPHLEGEAADYFRSLYEMVTTILDKRTI